MSGSIFGAAAGGVNGGLTSEQVIAITGARPFKYDATTAPGVNNDSNDTTNASDGVGFQVGSVWIDTTANEAYRCVDATDGAAIWINTTLETSELGSMALQAADSVAITGGSVTGITDITVADGGTGASTEAGARTNLDVFSKDETLSVDKYKTWTDWTIPNTTTVAGGPPLFTPVTYDWFEHINFTAADPFEMMVRIRGQAGTSINHYASIGQYADTNEEIHRLFAAAIPEVTGTTGSNDSVSGSQRIVENRLIKSQDNGDGTHTIWLTITQGAGSGRFQLGSAFSVATSISTFSVTRVRLANQSVEDMNFAITDVTSLTNATIQVDQRTMANPMTTEGDIIVGGVSGAPVRLAKGTALQVLRMNASATALEYAADASGDEARLSAIEYNLGVNSLRDAVKDGYTYFNMVGGVGDVFTDETGVNTVASTNEVYNSVGDYYNQSGDSNLLIQSGSVADSGGDDNNSTTLFTDSYSVHTITAKDNVRHSTEQAQFGTSSIKFDGAGDWLSVPDSEGFNFGSGDFTIDLWIYAASYAGEMALLSQWPNPNLSFSLRAKASNLEFFWSTTGADSFSATSSTVTLTTNAWNHVRLCRSGNTGYFFIRGQAAGTFTLNATLYNSTAALEVGSVLVGTTHPFNGYMEEVRILKGSAISTSAFTPPTSPETALLDNMTLQSSTFTTEIASVVSARPVVLWEDITTGSTLNTDFIFEVSRDGGTTWTASTLAEDAVFSGTAVMILTGSEVDLSAQPAGATATWRIRTANAKNIRVHGVYLQWR